MAPEAATPAAWCATPRAPPAPSAARGSQAPDRSSVHIIALMIITIITMMILLLTTTNDYYYYYYYY